VYFFYSADLLGRALDQSLEGTAAGVADEREVVQEDAHAQGLELAVVQLAGQASGDEDRRTFGVAQDVMHGALVKIRQNGHGHRADPGDGEVGHAPVGHVLGQKGHAVAGPDAVSVQEFSRFADPFAQFGIGHDRSVHHGQGGSVGVTLHAAFENLLQGQGFRDLHSLLLTRWVGGA
jgi:hypothetical protein